MAKSWRSASSRTTTDAGSFSRTWSFHGPRGRDEREDRARATAVSCSLSGIVSGSVAVGVFDGVHLGHVDILRCAVARARESQGRCVVVSFDPHPDVVLAKSFQSVPPL